MKKPYAKPRLVRREALLTIAAAQGNGVIVSPGVATEF